MNTFATLILAVAALATATKPANTRFTTNARIASDNAPLARELAVPNYHATRTTMDQAASEFMTPHAAYSLALSASMIGYVIDALITSNNDITRVEGPHCCGGLECKTPPGVKGGRGTCSPKNNDDNDYDYNNNHDDHDDNDDNDYNNNDHDDHDDGRDNYHYHGSATYSITGAALFFLYDGFHEESQQKGHMM
ncbi:hypothetical protein HRG_012541 [Hirsutella rhossiliensis]